MVAFGWQHIPPPAQAKRGERPPPTASGLRLESFCTGASASDFEVGPALRKGAYGTVHRAVRLRDGKKLCVKKVDLSKATAVEREEAANEVRLLAALGRGCRYVVSFEDCYVEGQSLVIVMEYARGGSLSDYLGSRKGRPLPEERVWRLFAQCLVALAHCHTLRVLHRDVKSSNVFLAGPSQSADDEAEVRLGDLGVGKSLARRREFASTMVGTPYYLSPELVERKPYGYKSDVWSLGVLLYEMAALKHPFDASSQEALFRRIATSPPSWAPLETRYSQELVAVCRACLTKDPERRPSAFALLESPVIRTRCAQYGIAVPGDDALRTMSLSASRPPMEPAQAAAALDAPSLRSGAAAAAAEAAEAEAAALRAEAEAARAEAEANRLEAEAGRLESLALTARAKAACEGGRRLETMSEAGAGPRGAEVDEQDDPRLATMGERLGETEERALRGAARIEAASHRSNKALDASGRGDDASGRRKSVAQQAAEEMRAAGGRAANAPPPSAAYRTSSQMVGSFHGKPVGSLYESQASFGRKRSDLMFVPDMRSRPSSAAPGGRPGTAAGARRAQGGGNALAPRGAARPSSARPYGSSGGMGSSSQHMSSAAYNTGSRLW